ncbi:MAG: hypothetical protein AAF420_01435 [Pseudomonadota bacterium]
MFDDYDIDEALFDEEDDDFFDDAPDLVAAFRQILSPDLAEANRWEIEAGFASVLNEMDPTEGLNFKKALKKIAKAGNKALKSPVTGQIAQTVLPSTGAAIGTIYGGPSGTAIGAKLGQAAGSAIAKQSQPKPKRVKGRAKKASAGSQSANQLLQLTQNPDVLKALMSLALGSSGVSQVKSGTQGTNIPVTDIAKLLSSLAKKASADAEALYGGTSSDESLLSNTWNKNELYAVLAGAEAERLSWQGEIYASALEDHPMR